MNDVTEDGRGRRLVLVRPRDLAVRGEHGLPDAFRLDGGSARAEGHGDTVTVTFPRLARRADAALALDASTPWEIEARGTVRRVRADLGAVTVRRFEVVSGSAIEVALLLPAPAGEVPVRFAGGASSVTILRPAGVPVRVRAGSASRLRLDEQRFGAIGGEVLWEVPGFRGAEDRYVIRFDGGVRDLTVDTLTAVTVTGRRAGRVVATVLFTDIVGSTARATALGDRRWRDVLDAHDALARRVVEAESGELVKTTGDGILAIFDEPGPAIRSALGFRGGLREHGVEIRAGVHAGEVEHRGADVGGIAVHTAARIMEVAEPGEVLVSRTVRDLVAGSDLVLEDRGTHTLRGVGDDWRLYAVSD